MLHRNALRLLKLVNGLLDFVRIEAGRLRASYQATNLSLLTAQLASVFRSAVERAGLQLVVDCPPLREPVYVDREMWEKIVLNLLSNAFKSTFDGEIRLTMRTKGTTAQLCVSDTGTGISASDLPHLFQRFRRIDGAQRRSHEGSGIGLALVQELVELHGGSIEVASTLGAGTTFTVTMPFGQARLSHGQIVTGK
jgi:signal transduction histidine kinase